MSHQRHSSAPPKSATPNTSDDNNDDEPAKGTSTQSESQQKYIPKHMQTLQEPRHSDVLFGRGRPFQKHSGNIRMQTIVERSRERYQEQPKLDKIRVVKEVIDEIRNHNPPVRFLKPIGGDENFKGKFALKGQFCEASEEETLKKIAHCLRAKTPKLILSLGKTKNQQHSSLTSIINPIDAPKTMRQPSVPRHPHARSNTPTSTGDMLPQISMQLKNPPTSIASKTRDEVATHGDERRPNHSDEWSSLTMDGRKRDLKHPASPYFPHEADLKPASKPKNLGERVGETSEMTQRPVPGHLPGLASLLPRSEASYASAAISSGESLSRDDSNNPTIVHETCIEPLRRADLIPPVSSDFPDASELKPAAKPKNTGESMEGVNQGQAQGRLPKKDDIQHNPRFSSLLSHSNTSHTAGLFSHGEKSSVVDSDNPTLVHDSHLEPVNATIQFAGSRSNPMRDPLSPESQAFLAQVLETKNMKELSPESLAFLARVLGTIPPINEPEQSDDFLNTNTVSQKSKQKLSSLPELDTTAESATYHFMSQNDTQAQLSGGEFIEIRGQESFDVETRTAFGFHPESMATPKSPEVHSLKKSPSNERNNEDDKEND